MAFLSVKNLSFAYKAEGGVEYQALKDISFEVKKGEYIAVIGANGSGKSTLARVICGLLPCAAGSVSGEAFRPEDFAVPPKPDENFKVPNGMVMQDPKDQITASIVLRDAEFGPQNLRLGREQARERACEALRLAGLPGLEERKTAALSGGQRQKLALAGIIALSPQMLILDEALSMIDPDGRRAILAFADSWHKSGGTVLSITHDRSEAARARRLLFLRRGELLYDGTLDDFEKRSDFFATDYCAPRKAESEGGKPRNAPALVWENVSFAYANQRILFNAFSLCIERGALTAVTGESGSGKTTLLELASGLLRPKGGKIRSLGRPVLAQQDCANSLFEEFAADDVAYGPRRQGLKGAELRARVKKAMDTAGVPFERFADLRISTLSGGQKRKLSLAGVIALDADVYLFDEPTAGLDPESCTAVFQMFRALCKSGKTVVFSTHRHEEAQAADRRVKLEHGALAADSAPMPLPAQGGEGLEDFAPFADAAVLDSFGAGGGSSFCKKDTPIHRLKPAAKWLAMLLLLVLSLATWQIPVLCGACALGAVYAALASYPAKKLAKNFFVVLPWLCLFFVFQMALFPAQGADKIYWQWHFVSITDAKIVLGVRSVLHYLGAMTALSVFVYSADETDILDGLNGLLLPLAKLKVPVQHFSLAVSIMFRYIPLLMEEAASIVKAQLVRCGGSIQDSGSKKRLFAKVRRLLPILVPLIIRTLKRAEALAEALQARYY